jgi:hypothetical protein
LEELKNSNEKKQKQDNNEKERKLYTRNKKIQNSIGFPSPKNQEKQKFGRGINQKNFTNNNNNR